MTTPRLTTAGTPVVRTDFSDDAAWEAVRAEIDEPRGEDEFVANVEHVDDRAYEGLAEAELRRLADDEHLLMLVVDSRTILDPEHPVLVLELDPDGGPGRAFRAVPAVLQSVENNLSIGNLDWEDFADAVDADGVLRHDDEDD